MEDMKAYTRVCKNCGKKLVSGAVFCGGCGTPVESEGPEPFPVYGENTRTAGGEKDGGSASFPVYGADTGAGTDSGYAADNAFGTAPDFGTDASYEEYDASREEYGASSGAEYGSDGEYSEKYSYDSEDSEASSLDMMKETAAEMAGSAVRGAAAVGSTLSVKAKEAARESKRRREAREAAEMDGTRRSLDGGGKYRKSVRNYYMQIDRRSLYCLLGGVAAMIIFSLLRKPGVGTVIFWICVLAAIVFVFLPNFAGQDEADEAKQTEIRRLQKRGIRKLKMESEDIDLIEPVVRYGPGIEPNGALGDVITKKVFFLFRPIVAFFRLFMTQVNKFDPILLYRVGSDDVFRYMLLQVTVYAFSNDQVLVYSGNVDTSTGRIYDESIMEVFYRDIAKVATNQELTKARKGREFRYYVNEYVELAGPGFKHVAAVASSLDNRKTDEEFLGMKNLIREKKKAMS